MEPRVYKTGGGRDVGWRRVVLWGAIGLVVLCVAAGGGFYLWFRAQVDASNQRVDPGVIQALEETPSSAAGVIPSSTTITSASSPSPSVSPSIPSSVSTSITAAPSSTTTSETAPEAPSGMNIVLLGSDSRASTGRNGRSDSIMVVHVDPKRDYLSVLSIPRDLLVTVPGHGPQKINTAYVYGGPALVIRTIQRELGIDLDHYLEVDFNAFKAITDKLGGVYVDIDRPYDDGLIQFQPGYQLLDGLDALRYVRTRHDRNYDFGRMERQQRFLSAVREQAMGWDLPFKLPGIVRSVFDNIDTDLSANDVLRLAYWGVKIDGSRIRLAKLSGGSQTIEGRSYVVISKATIAAAVKALLTAPPREPADTVTTSPGEEPSIPAVLQEVGLQGVSVDVENATGRVGHGALAVVWLLRQGASVGRVEEAAKPYTQGTVVTHPAARADEAKRVAAALGIAKTRQVSSSRVRVILGDDYASSADLIPEPAPSAGPTGAPEIRNAEEWRALAAATDFSLVAPTYLPKACTFAFRRDYSIAVDDKGVPAVRVGYRYGTRDRYVGLSETTWLDAPVASPGTEVAGPAGVVFTLVGTSAKTDHIWWVSAGVLKWVSNTLYFDLRREELLAIAVSTLPVTTGP